MQWGHQICPPKLKGLIFISECTIIEFKIKENGNYKLEIFHMLGKKIDEIMNEYKTAGSYQVNYTPVDISSGIYLYKLSSDKINLVRKFNLVK